MPSAFPFQIYRTPTADNPPPDNTLAEGELAVEMAVPRRLWVGVPPSIDPSGRVLISESPTVTVADSAPNVADGKLWWSSVDLQLYVGYDDGSSLQWVPTNSAITAGGGGSGTITGVTAGVGLSGGGTIGAVTVDLETPVPVNLGGTGATEATQGLTNLGGAPLVNPVFVGTPQAPTAPLNDTSIALATTAWVRGQNYTVSGTFLPISGGTLTGGVTAPYVKATSEVRLADRTIPANEWQWYVQGGQASLWESTTSAAKFWVNSAGDGGIARDLTVSRTLNVTNALNLNSGAHAYFYATGGTSLQVFDDGTSHLESDSTLLLNGTTLRPTTVGGVLTVNGRTTVRFPDHGSYQFLAAGTTYGGRIFTTTGYTEFAAVTQNAGGYAPMYLGGTQINLQISSSDRIRITDTVDVFAVTNIQNDRFNVIGYDNPGVTIRNLAGGPTRTIQNGNNNLNIGRVTTGVYINNLDMMIDQNGACFNASGTWSVLSSGALKQNVESYPHGLAEIRQLEPVYFQYAKGTPFADETTRVGLIASDVKPHLPEVVGQTTVVVADEPTEVETLDVTTLIYALVNAVKELADKVDELSAPTER